MDRSPSTDAPGTPLRPLPLEAPPHGLAAFGMADGSDAREGTALSPGRSNSGPSIPGPSILGKVAGDLRFIRDVIDSERQFRGVAGWGWVLMGVVACAAAVLAPGDVGTPPWIGTWIATAAIASATGLLSTYLQSRRSSFDLYSRVARQFWIQLSLPLSWGAALSILGWERGHTELLAGIWLFTYGQGLVSSGIWCRRTVRVSGAALQLLGLLAFIFPGQANLLLGLGFGGVHIFAGLFLARHES